MGRPKLPPDQQPTTRHVRLEPTLDTALCQLSLKTNISINSLLRIAAARLVQDSSRVLTVKSVE